MRTDRGLEVIGHQQMAGERRYVVPGEVDSVARVLPELVLARRQPMQADQCEPPVRRPQPRIPLRVHVSTSAR